MDDLPPLLVTLALEAAAQAHFDALRQAHFPPARNFLAAHVTLFHHLPGGARDAIEATLREAAAAQRAFAMRVAGLWMLGNGVAYRLEAPPLLGLRAALAARWDAWLTPQDRQRGFRPHITVQNKVPQVQAKALHDALLRPFAPHEIQAEGLLLWRYLGGPWERLAAFPFPQDGD